MSEAAFLSFPSYSCSNHFWKFTRKIPMPGHSHYMITPRCLDNPMKSDSQTGNKLNVSLNQTIKSIFRKHQCYGWVHSIAGSE